MTKIQILIFVTFIFIAGGSLRATSFNYTQEALGSRKTLGAEVTVRLVGPGEFGPPINSKFVDSAAVLMRTGLIYFLHRTGLEVPVNEDLWVASREDANLLEPAGQSWPMINSGGWTDSGA